MFPATAAKSIRKMCKCNCRVCKRSRKLEAVLRRYNMKPKDVAFLHDILTSLMTAELDRDWALAELKELKAKTKTERKQTNESTEK